MASDINALLTSNDFIGSVPKLGINRVTVGGITIYADPVKSTLIDISRSVTVRRTLDGGMFVQDLGGDEVSRTINISTEASLAVATALRHIFTINRTVTVTTLEGSFNCVGVSFRDSFGRIDMTFNVLSNEGYSLYKQIGAAYASGAA